MDCNTISTIFKCKDTLLATLENELEKTCDWFRVNNMILNPEKFQSMTLQKPGNTETYRLQIDGKLIETTSSVKLVGINISNKLTFDNHIYITYAAKLLCN